MKGTSLQMTTTGGWIFIGFADDRVGEGRDLIFVVGAVSVTGS